MQVAGVARELAPEDGVAPRHKLCPGSDREIDKPGLEIAEGHRFQVTKSALNLEGVVNSKCAMQEYGQVEVREVDDERAVYRAPICGECHQPAADGAAEGSGEALLQGCDDRVFGRLQCHPLQIQRRCIASPDNGESQGSIRARSPSSHALIKCTSTGRQLCGADHCRRLALSRP